MRYHIYNINIRCYSESKSFCLDFAFLPSVQSLWQKIHQKKHRGVLEHCHSQMKGSWQAWSEQPTSGCPHGLGSQHEAAAASSSQMASIWHQFFHFLISKRKTSSSNKKGGCIFGIPRKIHHPHRKNPKDIGVFASPRQTCWMPAFKSSRHYVIWSWSLPVRMPQLNG